MKSPEFDQIKFFEWEVDTSKLTGSSRIPFEENDYESNLNTRNALIEHWKSLESEDRKAYKDLRGFFTQNGYNDLTPPKKNYQILQEEIKKRVEFDKDKKILSLDQITNETDIFELLHSLEDTDKIKKIYRYQKKNSTDDIKEEVAEQIRNCFTQGRELFESGKNSSASVKPLLYFYSLTAYAYGLVVISNPIRHSLETLTGHHGLDFVHNEYAVKIGGDVPYGTFTDLLLSFPTNYLIDKENTHILNNNYQSIVKFFESNRKAKLGSLFSYIPELSSYLSDFLNLEKNIYLLKIKSVTLGKAVGYELIIGDGKTLLDEEKFDQLMKTKNEKIDGKLKYLIPLEEFVNLNLTIMQDIHGELYIIDTPLKFSIPEIAIHFMIMFAFSNIQRYDPPLWSKILNNKINSDVSYLAYRYIAIYEKKLPFLILRLINNIYPILEK